MVQQSIAALQHGSSAYTGAHAEPTELPTLPPEVIAQVLDHVEPSSLHRALYQMPHLVNYISRTAVKRGLEGIHLRGESLPAGLPENIRGLTKCFMNKFIYTRNLQRFVRGSNLGQIETNRYRATLFSPNGRFLSLITGDDRHVVYDFASSPPKVTPVGRRFWGSYEDLRFFSSDSRSLLVSQEDGRISLFSTSDLLRSVALDPLDSCHPLTSRDYCVTRSRKGDVKLVSLAGESSSWPIIRSFGRDRNILDVSSLICAVRHDRGAIEIIRCGTGETTHKLGIHSGFVRARLSPSGHTIVILTRAGDVTFAKIFDLTQRNPRPATIAGDCFVDCRISSDDRLLSMVNHWFGNEVWNIEKAPTKIDFAAHSQYATFSFSHDAQYIYSVIPGEDRYFLFDAHDLSKPSIALNNEALASRGQDGALNSTLADSGRHVVLQGNHFLRFVRLTKPNLVTIPVAVSREGAQTLQWLNKPAKGCRHTDDMHEDADNPQAGSPIWPCKEYDRSHSVPHLGLAISYDGRFVATSLVRGIRIWDMGVSDLE